MRNMSFSLTTPQMRARTKTVTRRLGWWFLKPGDLLCAVEKGQGLKKGERVVRIATVRVVSVRTERLRDVTRLDCAREGFPTMSPNAFVSMFMQHNRCRQCEPVNRIEFEYL